jgi:hypothetical protein
MSVGVGIAALLKLTGDARSTVLDFRATIQVGLEGWRPNFIPARASPCFRDGRYRSDDSPIPARQGTPPILRDASEH